MILMTKVQLIAWTLGVVLLLAGGGARSSAAAADTCGAMSVGVSVALGDTFVFNYDTRGQGETFKADHLRIQSISVWRPVAEDWDIDTQQISIMPVDSTGTPVMDVIAVGPTVSMPVGDGNHPVEYRFVFEPPLQLPHVGEYFFRLIQPDCYGIFYFLSVAHDAYQDGRPWKIFGTRYACGEPTFPSMQFPDWDLVFQVTFCDEAVPVRRASWGKMKALYR